MRHGRFHLSYFPVLSEITVGFPTSVSKRLSHLCYSCPSAVCLVWGWGFAVTAGTLLSSTWRFLCKQQENPKMLLFGSSTSLFLLPVVCISFPISPSCSV